jgi:hypothetical protein
MKNSKKTFLFALLKGKKDSSADHRRTWIEIIYGRKSHE